MRPIVLILCLLVAAETPSPAPSIDDLAWLAGCWASTDEQGGRTEECWTAPAGGLMLGTHRMLRPGRAAWFEFLRIEAGEGGIAYLASPGGREATRFPLAAHGEQSVTFENPQHDFPQRIVYQRRGETLTVRAEAERDGETRGSTWTWTRVPFPDGVGNEVPDSATPTTVEPTASDG